MVFTGGYVVEKIEREGRERGEGTQSKKEREGGPGGEKREERERARKAGFLCAKKRVHLPKMKGQIRALRFFVSGPMPGKVA